MSLILSGDSGITFPNSSTQAVGFYGFKNRIINGAMAIDQRNAGASVTLTNGYTLDRWQTQSSPASKATFQQNAGSVTPPVGFVNYAGITSTSSYSVSAGDYFNIWQPIEGLNVGDLGWGTANAKTVTLSAWIYSSLTGTFGGAFRNADATRSYPFTYSIPVANTWTQISVTVAGDTTGTWLKTNGIGIGVFFSIGTGSTYSGTAGTWAGANYTSATGATSVVGTNGATFYITGVQLEAGSTATSFDYRPYGTELDLCQRYFCVLGAGNGYNITLGVWFSTTQVNICPSFPVTMRTAPSVYSTTGTGYYGIDFSGISSYIPSWTAYRTSPYSTMLFCTGLTGGTTGAAGQVFTNNASSFLGLSAEL